MTIRFKLFTDTISMIYDIYSTIYERHFVTLFRIYLYNLLSLIFSLN